ncbi:metallophosphoesterase family protein [Myroides sp. LJL119]
MQKILLLSDTHSTIDETILKYVHWADQVWHAGDIGNQQVVEKIQALKPLVAVYGNIDSQEIRDEFPKEIFWKCQQMGIYMTHIGGYPGKYNSQVKLALEKYKPQIYICGHSHILKIQYDQSNQVLHLNPGAAGISGFHQVRTMLKFILEKGQIKDLEVIQWPKNKKTEQ